MMQTPRPLQTPRAKIHIILKSSKGTDANKASEVALSSLSEDQRTRFDRVHAHFAKQKTCCSLGSVYPPGLCGHPRLGQCH